MAPAPVGWLGKHARSLSGNCPEFTPLTTQACTENFSIQTAILLRLRRDSRLGAKCGSMLLFDWHRRRRQVRAISSFRQIVRSRRVAFNQAMNLSIVAVVPPRQRQRGVTLIELLVIIAIIGMLAGLLWPALARAKQKATQVACMSNMKQIAHALQMYMDDNLDTLPGPCFTGARASYDKTSGTELIYYIANYLGSPSPSWVTGKQLIVEVFICPGYRRQAPGVTSMEGRKCFLLNDDIDPNPVSRVRPFGYPELEGKDEIPPLKFSALYTYGTPATLFAITDVDKINVPNPKVDWWTDLPYKPVHGQVRNELYFDWHVAGKRAW